MIPLGEINSLAESLKVPAETIEKDYVISWILACLAQSTLKDDFTFYGGTAIKRIYFEDHRFSEDIDLISEKNFKTDHLIQNLTSLLTFARTKANLVLEVDSERLLSNGTRTQMFIRYSGYDEIIGAPKEIRIDFAMDMALYGETAKSKIIETYSDLKKKDGTLPVHTLNTILANKLGLLMDSARKEPRDLYDVWFLLNRLKQFDFNLKKVSKYFHQKYGFAPTLGVLRPHLENRIYQERWQERLVKQIVDLPPINSVIRSIEGKLEEIF